MKAILGLIAIALVTVGWGNVDEDASTATDSTSTAPVHVDTLAIVADTTITFTVEAGSRLYPDWKEQQTVSLHQEFYIGDTEFMGVIRAYMPDFKIKNGKPFNWSMEMNNPAAFVHVFTDSAVVDSAWAFLNFPPHFSPNSFFTFKLTEVSVFDDPQPMEKE